MNKIIWILILLVVIGGIAVYAVRMNGTNKTIETKLDHGASALGITITPKKVLEDSRCPQDADCVWMGTVRVQTLLTTTAGETERVFTLAEPITKGGAEITLVKVEPVLMAGKIIPPANYMFYFEFKKS